MDKRFPKVGDIVKFNIEWALITGEIIEPGTFGEIMLIDYDKGYSMDLYQNMYIGVGIYYKDNPIIIRISYLDRSDVITVIPDTPAAQVLFGKKDGQT